MLPITCNVYKVSFNLAFLLGKLRTLNLLNLMDLQYSVDKICRSACCHKTDHQFVEEVF